MTGVLYARVSGAWVPIAVQAQPPISIDPGYVGPRRDGATAVASHAHVNAPSRTGISMWNNGDVAGIVGNGRTFWWTQVNAAGTGEDWIGEIELNAFQISDLRMGLHPGIALQGIWLNSNPAAANYILANNNDTFLNCAPANTLRLRVGNVDIMTMTAGAIYPMKMVQVHFTSAGAAWDTAHLLAWSDAAGSSQGTRIAAHQAGYWAPQLRVSQWDTNFAVVDANGTSYANISASSFTVASSLDFKRDVTDVRSIGLERERIVVRHDPASDTVPELDVMALRPVAFRPKVGHLRPTAQREDGTWDVEEWPEDTSPGREGRRERLGLVAEEVQHVIPSAVTHGAVGNVVGIDYAQITVALLAHVQRLTEEVATLRYRVAELEGQP